MNSELYTEFLDWLRKSQRVVLRLEDGTVLAEGHRPRSEFDEEVDRVRSAEITARPFVEYSYSLGLLRRWHGDAVDEFLRGRES